MKPRTKRRMNKQDVAEYYEQLRSLPEPDRNRIGLLNEYLGRAEAQENDLVDKLLELRGRV